MRRRARVSPAYGKRSRFQRQERQAVRGPAEEGHEQGPRRGDLQRERRVGQRRLEEGRQEQLVGQRQQPEQQEQRLRQRRQPQAEAGGGPQGRLGRREQVLRLR